MVLGYEAGLIWIWDFCFRGWVGEVESCREWIYMCGPATLDMCGSRAGYYVQISHSSVLASGLVIRLHLLGGLRSLNLMVIQSFAPQTLS